MKMPFFCSHWMLVKRLWIKAFWRIMLPSVLALVMAIAGVLEAEGRLRQGFFPARGSLYGTAILFSVLFGVSLWNTIHWGKEAEEYESNLKEADQIEKDRRRRSNWIER